MAATDLQTNYAGRKGRLFRLALWTSLLTVLTLGIYRFWMKTRLRRYYWSAIRPGGQPLEYVGQPLEKLLGFLIAVTFLAFYIGIVNLLLMFLSFSLLQTNIWAYGMSLVGIVPILFYARYRARRYILARTRWRGVRFGMEQGAWAYTWRALLHWLLTILSVGLLWPRMTFALEKFRTDRTFFGSERFNQGGKWTMLYRPFLPLFLAMVLVATGVGIVALLDEDLGLLPIGLGTLLASYGIIHYRVGSFRLLTNTKTLGCVGFISNPRPWRVYWIYSFGYGLVMLAISVLLIGLVFVFFLIVLGGQSIGDEFEIVDITQYAPLWVSQVIAAVGYFSIFILWGTLAHVLVTLPLARHYAETLEITGAVGLGDISQRERDDMEQAEGFAEALDVGAAI